MVIFWLIFSVIVYFFCFRVFSTSIKCIIDYNIEWNRPLWYDSHIYLAKLGAFYVKVLET